MHVTTRATHVLRTGHASEDDNGARLLQDVTIEHRYCRSILRVVTGPNTRGDNEEQWPIRSVGRCVLGSGAVQQVHEFLESK
jgi:hypothetical protein